MGVQADSLATSVEGPPVEDALVEEQLRRILASRRFKRSPRISQILQFVVQETLDGRAGFIKARTIAIRVLARDPSDEPENDPMVRIHARRLRRALALYYENEGCDDPILITVPKGGYVPTFSFRSVKRASELVPAGTDVRSYRLPRIAVLPFGNSSGSPQYDYFADGLGAELSGQLARFQELAVLAYWTTSKHPHESLDVARVGRELDADFVLAGMVSRGSDRLRVRVQCVHTESGEQVWAAKFDRPLTTGDLLGVEDEIVGRVVACVADCYGSVPETLFRASHGKPIKELTAYEAVLAMHHYTQRLDQESRDSTLAALEHAVKTEPTYALAWAMLGTLYCDRYAFDSSAGADTLKVANEYADQATTLDQNCQYAHYTSTYVGVLTQDSARVMAACERIVSLNPQAAFLVGAASVFLGIAGQIHNALPLLQRSLDLNPYYPGWFHILHWLRDFTRGDYEAALEEAHRFKTPSLFWDPLLRAACLGKLGYRKPANAAFQQVIELCPAFPARYDHYLGCFVHADETRQDVLDGLRKAGLG